MCDRIEKLEEDLKILAGMPPFAAINYIRCGIGYNEYIREYAGYRKMKPEELNDVMDELQQSARKYRTFEEWCTYIQDYTLELQKTEIKEAGGRNHDFHAARCERTGISACVYYGYQ